MLEIHTVVPFGRILKGGGAALPRPRPSRRAAEGREVFRKVVNVTSISGTQGNVGPGELLVGQGRPDRADEDPRAGEWGPRRR